MISPCMCRGTSAFIHEACLQRYFEFYPDGHCRVCTYQMHPYATRQFIDAVIFGSMILWFCFLLLFSSVPEYFKFLYLFLFTASLFLAKVTDSLRNVTCIGLMALSSVFLVLSTSQSIQLILLLGIFGSIAVMCLYIPPEFMLFFMTIVLAGAYSTMILIFFMMNQDSYLVSFFVPTMILLWLCVIRARPPLRG